MPAPTSRPQPPSAWRSQPPQRPSVTGEGKTRRNSYVKKYEADVRLDWQEHAACLVSAPDFDYDQKPPPRVQAANPRPRKPPEHVEEAKQVCVIDCGLRARSEERRVGPEWVSVRRSRWPPFLYNCTRYCRQYGRHSECVKRP